MTATLEAPIAPATRARSAVPTHWDHERDLLDRLRRGEAEAFEELVREHGQKLLSVCRRFLPVEADAQDAAQDALLLAFRSLERFRGEASLSTWLHRIAVNASIARLRSARRRPEARIEDLLPHFDGDDRRLEPADEKSLDGEETLDREETRAQVRAAIARLPEAHRTVILLRDIEGRSTGETARALGISIACAKVRLHRARQALLEILRPTMARG